MTTSDTERADRTARLRLDSRTSGSRISTVRIEHGAPTLGVGVAQPRLSWTVDTDQPGWRQSAFELERRAGSAASRTGRVASGDSSLVRWPFEPLASRERATIRVRAWSTEGVSTGWSEPFDVETGLLDAADWQARFVDPSWDEDLGSPQPCPFLRHEFDLSGPVRTARLYVTALGVYELHLNGEAVGDHVLAPGWTSYHHRLRYQTFDVGQHLRPGRNAIGAILGDGWFRGRLGPHGGRRNIYGDRLALLAQLEVEYEDGTAEIVVTDGSWRAATGPLLGSDLYDGETYDARLERDGWAEPGFDDADWTPVRILDRDLSTLVAPSGPPVRRTQVVRPVAVTLSPSGKPIVDFGQNLVGRLRIRVSGRAGDTIRLRHAEILEHGELCVRPLRQAAATDRYTLRGDGEEVWEPCFTFHGFRYAELDGWPGPLGLDDVEAVVCHSDLERTGGFECSDPLVDRLHENVVWSMRGNFLDVPTDCAQRDERLGWTGDVQVFAPTALFLHRAAGFLTSWLADLAVEQDEEGRVPNVVPQVLDGLLVSHQGHAAPAAAWGDAAVIVPWTIYERTGDRDVLAAQYGSMRAWVDLVTRLAGETRLWDTGFQYGDWLDPSAPPDRPARGMTDPALVATAYFARSADLLARSARLLGRLEDAGRYAELAGEVRAAFVRAYVTAAGLLASDSPTAYALALQFELLDDAQRRRAGQRLVELVRENGFRIGTGFVGTPLICDALCASGAHDAAYRLLLERGCPSWLYPVTMGATTIWERWDSLLPDGSVNPGEMTSFNHYALGAVADWVHRTVAGLAPAEPGYRRLAVEPRPGGSLTHARAWHETPYGRAEVGWSLRDGTLDVVATVPPNTTATVRLPPAGSEAFEVAAGTHRWSVPLPSDGDELYAGAASANEAR
jgi:alpha-L-rhamnosidase